MKKRVHYNWKFMIEELGLQSEFYDFQQENNFKQHKQGKKELSYNRLARAFILHIQNKLGLHFLKPCFIKGQEQSLKEWIDSSN